MRMRNKYKTFSERNPIMHMQQIWNNILRKSNDACATKRKEHLQLNKKWWPQSCIWQHCLTLWSSLLAFLVINRSWSWLLQTSPSSWWYNDDIEGGHLEVSVHAKVLRHQAIVDSVTEKTANVHCDKKNLRGFQCCENIKWQSWSLSQRKVLTSKIHIFSSSNLMLLKGEKYWTFNNILYNVT